MLVNGQRLVLTTVQKNGKVFSTPSIIDDKAPPKIKAGAPEGD